ncbi:MAG: hypothetical protein UW83_C0018G0019, partial [Parcubacteria group bacterium GW2011_GWD1_44_9]
FGDFLDQEVARHNFKKSSGYGLFTWDMDT